MKCQNWRNETLTRIYKHIRADKRDLYGKARSAGYFGFKRHTLFPHKRKKQKLILPSTSCKEILRLYIYKLYRHGMELSSRAIRGENVQHVLPYKPGLIWNRSHFNLTEDEFYRNSETLKDLNMVWEISDDFNAKNTIIMDDTSTKVSSQPYNLMLMSTFEHSTNADSFAEDDLLKAIAYLKKLRYQTNVANYMKNHPFDVSFNYEIEKVNPCERSYIGHYVKGVWVNPPSALPLSEEVEKKQKTKKGLAEDSKVPSIDDVKQTAQEKRKEKRKEKKRRKMLLRKAKEAEDAK